MASTPLPMTVSWSGAPSPRFILRIRLAPDPPPEADPGIRALVKDFVRVGSQGGFVPVEVSPAQGDLALVKESAPSGRQLEFEVTGKQLDTRAFYVLRNALEGFGSRVHGVQLAAVEDRTPGMVGRPLAMKGVRYPDRSEKIGLAIEVEDPGDYAKDRRCLVDFGAAVPGETLAKLADWVRSWARLAGMGAWSPPLKPAGESQVLLGTLAPYDEGSVELVFSRFDAEEEAWDVLFNMLDRFSGTVARITRVERQ